MLIQLGTILDNALEFASLIIGKEFLILNNVIVLIFLLKLVKDFDSIFGFAVVHEVDSLFKLLTVGIVDQVDRLLRLRSKRPRHSANYNQNAKKGCFHIIFVFWLLLYIINANSSVIII